jgi:hypothetical protein
MILQTQVRVMDPSNKNYESRKYLNSGSLDHVSSDCFTFVMQITKYRQLKLDRSRRSGQHTHTLKENRIKKLNIV